MQNILTYRLNCVSSALEYGLSKFQIFWGERKFANPPDIQSYVASPTDAPLKFLVRSALRCHLYVAQSKTTPWRAHGITSD